RRSQMAAAHTHTLHRNSAHHYLRKLARRARVWLRLSPAHVSVYRLHAGNFGGGPVEDDRGGRSTGAGGHAASARHRGRIRHDLAAAQGVLKWLHGNDRGGGSK